SPVCTYPAGASYPHGVMDMAGNVWEWQANFADKDNDVLALRGGSRFNYLNLARAAARYGSNPYLGWDGVGFRVVASPPPP
ncbi:MAG: formylglycine-generating enzyme family protein, partial [Anaerolineales bacterium]